MTTDLHASSPERVDHYGRPSRWFMDYPSDYLDASVHEAKAIELASRIEFGLDLFLVWGSLLGAVRGGDLIPHDFDIDMAYVSRARSAQGVLRERAVVLAHFQRFGRVLDGHSPGRFMLRGIGGPGDRFDHGIEIYTCFVTQGLFYAYPTLPGTLPSRAIRPFRQVALHGVSFNAPKRSEAFLDQAIGPDWRVPRLPKDHKERTGRFPCFDFLYPPGG
ncbi:hypothetical protein [Thetidibacter halocola]|uniref:LicD family protein n=1 Tax=Thetidibacter halocola TaxID=2827239 RepID=A0A8J8B9V1_9RHOB|nr:hypothetical protein [Thetidibacter halocola]MBS0124578.1 hypothetical protein [Thetidibacter halocola]